MSMSGINFDKGGKNVVEEFNDVRNERDFCMFKIANSAISDCPYLTVNEDHEIPELVEAIKQNKKEPHWAAFDVEVVTNERPVVKRVLVTYCPDTLTIKQKMTTASTHMTVKKAVAPQKEIKVSTEEELDSDTITKMCAEECAENKPYSKISIKHTKKSQ